MYRTEVGNQQKQKRINGGAVGQIDSTFINRSPNKGGSINIISGTIITRGLYIFTPFLKAKNVF